MLSKQPFFELFSSMKHGCFSFDNVIFPNGNVTIQRSLSTFLFRAVFVCIWCAHFLQLLCATFFKIVAPLFSCNGCTLRLLTSTNMPLL